MSGEKRASIWINPLRLFEAEDGRSQPSDLGLDYERIVRFLCTPGLPTDAGSIAGRCQEISNTSHQLFAAPAEEHILDKLVWPLRHAKGCYLVGNYLGTISLCGMVAEMIAVLLFDISPTAINGRLLDDAAQEQMFGRTFEKLGQERRVSILHAYGLIDRELERSFDSIRKKRNRYLHLYSQDYARLPSDAVEVFDAAVSIVVKVIGQDIRNGKIALNPALLAYLEKRGIVRPDEDGESG